MLILRVSVFNFNFKSYLYSLILIYIINQIFIKPFIYLFPHSSEISDKFRNNRIIFATLMDHFLHIYS